MSYNVKDLEMIQGFIIRNEAALRESLKYDTLDKLQKEMEREILYTRHIESGMPRVFISSQEDEKNFKDFGMATGMVAVLVDKNETIDIQGIESSKNRMTAMVINGVGLNQIDAEVLGELIVYNDLIKLDSSKDLVELARAYRAREVQDDTKVVSTRPAPKPTVEKEVIDTDKVKEAMDKEVKDAQNLLGVKSVEDTVEDQVNAEKEKKPFTFKMNLDALKEDNNNAAPKLKKAGSNGVKPKFTGFENPQFMAEDGKVNAEGVPLKFALNDVAKEAVKEKGGSIKLETIVSPETLEKFTRGTHDATEQELKALNEAPTPTTPVEDKVPDLSHIYFVDEDNMLSGVSRDEESREFIRANWDNLVADGNYIVIENGSMRKLDGSYEFTLEEREYLVDQFRNIITDPNLDTSLIPQEVLDVMEMEVEDWDNNQNIDNID
jgi:hypothetical protein|nr:MAG TPA: hypothetical protein [Caudoviricetes sp.]